MIPWRLWEESKWAAIGMSAANLAVALLCLFNYQKQSAPFWLPIAALYLLLSLDRFLGLLSRLSAFLRKQARIRGLYWKFRRPFQATLMLLFAASIAALCELIPRHIRSPSHTLALAAALYSICLVILRAISLHEMDMILYRRRKFLAGGRLNLPIESLGLILMLIAAF